MADLCDLTGQPFCATYCMPALGTMPAADPATHAQATQLQPWPVPGRAWGQREEIRQENQGEGRQRKKKKKKKKERAFARWELGPIHWEGGRGGEQAGAEDPSDGQSDAFSPAYLPATIFSVSL